MIKIKFKKAALVTRNPKQPNPFTPTFTMVFQGLGWCCMRRHNSLLNEEEQRAY
jgi:hypothetical protein